MVLKICTLLFALFALRRVWTCYRKGQALVFELVLWAPIWSALAVVVFIPQKTDVIAQWLGLGSGYRSGFSALTFAAIVGLLFAVYRLTARTHQLDRDLTSVVRALALERAEKK
jgi:hypothetical protein